MSAPAPHCSFVCRLALRSTLLAAGWVQQQPQLHSTAQSPSQPSDQVAAQSHCSVRCNNCFVVPCDSPSGATRARSTRTCVRTPQLVGFVPRVHHMWLQELQLLMPGVTEEALLRLRPQVLRELCCDTAAVASRLVSSNRNCLERTFCGLPCSLPSLPEPSESPVRECAALFVLRWSGKGAGVPSSSLL